MANRRYELTDEEWERISLRLTYLSLRLRKNDQYANSQLMIWWQICTSFAVFLSVGNLHLHKNFWHAIKSSGVSLLLMDRAYEGDATRKLALKRGYIPVVPPKSNRKFQV